MGEDGRRAVKATGGLALGLGDLVGGWREKEQMHFVSYVSEHFLFFK